jgi:hypothetical protein
MNEAEAIHYLTHDQETGEDTGYLSVPCSRWGRNSAQCAPVAWDLHLIYCEANGEPDDERVLLDFLMGLVVNDHDDVGTLLWEHGSDEIRERYADELEDFRPREALSSGHFSADTQLADVVQSLTEDERARFDTQFPEWDQLQWDDHGSWIDTEASGVDVEYTSWAIDWIEDNTSIRWDDGEPYRFD